MTTTNTSAFPAATPSSEAKWSEQKTKLKAKFNNLTDADLTFAEGKKDEMLHNLETKLGKTKEELGTIMASL